jgi:two-component system chemotaxis response regulator CheB
MEQEPRYLVVIGASAGGFTVLDDLVSQLKPDTDAAYLVVLHLSTQSISGYLAHRLQQHTTLTCTLAEDGMPLRKGQVYVAVPNYHLLVTRNAVKLGYGPAENRWRPSIDLLFRSAAVHFTTRVIGIVLTGLLNDGTTGMSAIQHCGGTTIVQDPNEAEYPDMPLSVINSMEVDYVLPLSQIGTLLEETAGNAPEPEQQPPPDLIKETAIAENLLTDVHTQESIGTQTPYTCPDCGGVLYQRDQDAITRFKCFTGHSFSMRDLLLKQGEEVEDSLWFAIRSLEQRRTLLESLSAKYTKTGNTRTAAEYQKRKEEIEQHINNLKNVLMANLKLPNEE